MKTRNKTRNIKPKFSRSFLKNKGKTSRKNLGKQKLKLQKKKKKKKIDLFLINYRK
jgi:hypothetical protein